MNFLVPFYLLGALAVAIPIYLHLRRRPPKDIVEFGSLMFLRPTKHQPLKRRSQLENLPLLLLRCLALLLLAAMFGRPFLRGGDTELAEGRMRTVILLDASASMRREGMWAAAQAEAEEVVEQMGADGSLTILIVDGGVRTAVAFRDWSGTDVGRRKETAKGVLKTLNPGWGSSNLGNGLVAAAELLADASGGEEARSASRIVVISDLQGGAALEAVAEAAWPSDLRVELRPVESGVSTNASLALAPSPDPERPIVRVRNDPASEETNFVLRAGGSSLAAVVPAGESRTFQLEEAASEVMLSGDGQEFDNRLFLAPREAVPVTLQFIGREGPTDSSGPEYYFRSAFGLSEVLQPRFVEDLQEEPAILAIGRALDEVELSEVQRQLEAGGQALILLASTGMAETLGRLARLEKTPALSEAEGDYVLLENIDFDHPALREFRDPRWRDFTGVHFWKHRVLVEEEIPAGRVVARFDNGDVAWLDVPVGRGRLLVMTSGWQPRDSQLALSSKFLPLLFSIFADRGPSVGGEHHFFVDEPLPLEVGERVVTLPSGELRRLESGDKFLPEAPGIYRVAKGDLSRSFAVNLRPSESELVPLRAEALTALGVPVAGAEGSIVAGGTEGTRRLRDHEAEANQNLWRWAVVTLLALLVIESWLATRLGRAQLQQVSTA